MAKKKSKKNKKTPKPKSGGQSPRLESKLLGYWKKGHCGEFVTLFARHWGQARKTAAAHYWDRAVFNALTRALFDDQDFTLLAELLNTLETVPELSAESRACGQMCRAMLDLVHGKASPSRLRGLPRDLPQPFADLRDRVAAMCLDSGSSPLTDYVLGYRKKARKGEKTLSLAARASAKVQELNWMVQPLEDPSMYTQIRKMFKDLNESFAQGMGWSSPVLADAEALAELMREVMLRPWSMQQPCQLSSFLRFRGFSFTEHDFTLDFLESILSQGRTVLGPSWEQNMRLCLAQDFPRLLSPLPEEAKRQLEAVTRLKDKACPSSQPYSMPAWLKQLLNEDVWSFRERFFLHLTLLTAHRQLSRDLAFDLGQPCDLSLEERAAQLIGLIQHSTENLLALLDLQKDIFPRDMAPVENALQAWEECLEPLPLDLDPAAPLNRLTRRLAKLPLSAARFLFLLAKSTDTLSSQKLTSIIEHIRQNKPELQLTEIDFPRAFELLDMAYKPKKVFQSWQAFLSSKDQRRLAERYLMHLFARASSDENLSLAFSLDDICPWCDLPIDLFKHLLKSVNRDFALRGLMELTITMAPVSPPMPQKAAQARPLLDQLPPPQTLSPMLLWMLTWPQNSYSAAFYEQLIRNAADHITERQGWKGLAQAVSRFQLKDLAARIWDLWTELGLFDRSDTDQSFDDARELLRPLARAGTWKGRGRPKGRTLLDEVLEERRQKKKKGR